MGWVLKGEECLRSHNKGATRTWASLVNYPGIYPVGASWSGVVLAAPGFLGGSAVPFTDTDDHAEWTKN